MVIFPMKFGPHPVRASLSPQKHRPFPSAIPLRRRLFFSTTYKLLFPQPLSFHIHMNCPRGVGVKKRISGESHTPPANESLAWTPILKLRTIDFQLSTAFPACPELLGEPQGVNVPLSPLHRTLTKNAPACPDLRGVSPLELTLTKYKDLKSHRITLLQKRGGEGGMTANQKTGAASTHPLYGAVALTLLECAPPATSAITLRGESPCA